MPHREARVASRGSNGSRRSRAIRHSPFAIIINNALFGLRAPLTTRQKRVWMSPAGSRTRARAPLPSLRALRVVTPVAAAGGGVPVLRKIVSFAEEIGDGFRRCENNACGSMGSTSTHAVREPHTFFSGRMSGVGSGTMCDRLGAYNVCRLLGLSDAS
jgi:hypothetical protein